MRTLSLALVAALAGTFATGCERNKDADKLAVEELVTQRLEAEKAKQTAELNVQLTKENTDLKAKVEELEKKLATITATQTRVAQANVAKPRETAKAAATEEHKQEVKKLHDSLIGAGSK